MKKIIQIALFVSLFVGNSKTFYSQIEFLPNTTFKVVEYTDTLANPWAGGLSAAQFSTCDLDLDGKQDLVIFDRADHKVSTYLNKGVSGTVKYEYAPVYEKFIPRSTGWMLFRDYNCDGKKDIFIGYPGGIRVYKNISYDDKALYKSQYSQEKESTADLQGLEYYKNTNYSLKPINGVFDVLKYAYLPFDDVAFDTTYFESGQYVFPSDYKLKELNPISPEGNEDEDEDEEILKTHPGADDRREAMLNEITLAELKNNSKKVFVVSTDKEFKKIRNICRFEMPRMYLLHGYYEMAFYNAFLLEEAGFTNNIYLDKMKAKAIGQMARSINNGNRPSKSRVNAIEDNMQGESQQLYYFLNSLGRKRKEFNIFAVQYTYKTLKKYPKDEELKNMFSDLIYDLYEETNLKFSSFRKSNIAEITEEIDDSAESDSLTTVLREKSEKEKIMDEIREKDSKYNKIEEKVKEQKEEKENPKKVSKKAREEYYKYAFAEFMADKNFVREAKKIQKRYKAQKNKVLSDAEQKVENKKNKLDRSRGLALGIEKVVVVNPIYVIIQGEDTKLYQSEKAQEEYNAIIAKIARISKLDLEIIDTKNLSSSENKAFKNAAVLNEYIAEQFLIDEDFDFSSIEIEKIKELKQAYGTKYFLWTGVVSIAGKKHTLIFNLLYDIETSKVLYKEYKDVQYRTNKTIIKSELYHVFDQINTNRKIK